jgi:predicted transcriptional regulator
MPLAAGEVVVALSLRKVTEVLECRVFSGEGLIDQIMVEYGCATDLMSDALAFSKPGSLLITGMTNAQVVRTAVVAAMVAIVLVHGKKPLPDTIEIAERKGIPLLGTDLFMFEAAGRLHASNLPGR